MSPKILESNPYGALEAERLQQFEEQHNIALPEDYKVFLLKNNGGRPAPSFFWIEPGKDGSTVHQFYGLHDGPGPFRIDTYTGDERYGIPLSFIPVADDGTGNYICLKTSGENMNGIYFLDHERHSYHEPESSKGLTKLADSFSDFLSSLQEPPANE